MSKANDLKVIGQLAIIRELHGNLTTAANEFISAIIAQDEYLKVKAARNYMDAAEKVEAMQITDSYNIVLNLNLMKEDPLKSESTFKDFISEHKEDLKSINFPS